MSDPTLIAAAISAISVVLGPIIAYVAASRRLSGKIQTSEAKDLWRESASIRDDYRARLKEALFHIGQLEKSNSELRSELNDMKLRMSDVIIENNQLRRKISDLQGAA